MRIGRVVVAIKGAQDVAIYGELPTDMVSRVDADLSRFLDRGVI